MVESESTHNQTSGMNDNRQVRD